MKVTIPEALKSDMPQNQWGKILTATPVIMTVVATMLAGLASSEMTRAQYDRALAAQQQSKAGDQWSFFQAKRVRAALQRNTVELLEFNGGVRALDPATLRQSCEAATGDAAAQAKVKAEMAAVLASPAGSGRPRRRLFRLVSRPGCGCRRLPPPRLRSAPQGLHIVQRH